VPDTTTVPARPWYPTGRWVQFGGSSEEPRRIAETFSAWWREEKKST